MHRIIPKNFVLCVTLLLILLEIINTPAVSTNTKNTMAAIQSVCPVVLLMISCNVKWLCLFTNLVCSIRIPISAILKMEVTRKTAKIIHKMVIRFCRL